MPQSEERNGNGDEDLKLCTSVEIHWDAAGWMLAPGRELWGATGLQCGAVWTLLFCWFFLLLLFFVFHMNPLYKSYLISCAISLSISGMGSLLRRYLRHLWALMTLVSAWNPICIRAIARFHTSSRREFIFTQPSALWLHFSHTCTARPAHSRTGSLQCLIETLPLRLNQWI